MPEERQVTVETHGRGGTIWYCEGPLRIGFDWEFGGSCLALIWGGSLRQMRDAGSVTADRAREILDFVARQVIAQKASGYSFKIDEASCEITVG